MTTWSSYGPLRSCAKFDDSSLSRSRDITGVPKVSSVSRVFDHAPFKGHLSYVCWDWTQSTCVQNLTTIASAAPEIRLVPTKILMVHVT